MGTLNAVGKVACDYVSKTGVDVCGIGGAIYDELSKTVHAVGSAIAGAAETVWCFFSDCSPPPDPPPPPLCPTDPNQATSEGTQCVCPAGTGLVFFTKTVDAGYGNGSHCIGDLCTNTFSLEYCRTCKKSEALIDGQCKTCPAYMNKSADGTRCELIQCAAGQRYTQDKHGCFSCPAGTHYSEDGSKCDQDPIDCSGTGKQAMQTNAPTGAAHDAVSKSLGWSYEGKGWMCGCPEGTWFDGKQCREKPFCDPAKHLEFNETTGTCRPTVDCAAGEIIVTEQKGEFWSDVCKKCGDGEVAVNGVCTIACKPDEARGAMVYGATSVPVCVPCPGGTAAGGTPDAYGEATACRSQCDQGTEFNPYSVSYDALQGLSLGSPGAGLGGGAGNFSAPGASAGLSGVLGGNNGSGPKDKAVKGGVCEVCPAGTKAVFGTASIAGVDISMATCVPCPDGETSSAGATSCHHVFKWKPKGTKIDEGRGRGRDDGDKRRRDDGDDKPARKTEERGGRRDETPIRLEREPRPTRSETSAPAGCGAGRVMSSSGRCVIDLEGGGGGGSGFGGGSRAPSGGGGGAGGARGYGGGSYYNPKP
jgi:hypothetical protein